ncbi:MAG: extradiol ring-cleavage dioxygenase [Thermoleophilia bacterium]|nr:extradiol ring-cleavage dioxygenase [Thermoleophilia bacterium]
MSLVGCFVTPHPPIVVPVVGGRRLGQVAATAEALRALGEQARHLRPDAIALMSPHARLDPGRMGVSTCSRYEGSLAYFGAPEVHVALEGAPGLAQAILSQAAARGVAAAPIPARGGILELDHGSLVPLVYLLEHLDPLPSLVLLSFSDLSAPAHLTFGRAVGAAADGAADRVLYVASGDLSHRLTPDAPAGYNPRAADFDRAVVDALAAGSEEALLGIPPRLQHDAGECGYRSLLTLFGLLSGREFKPRVLSYEGPFGVGYLVAAIELAAPAAAST